VAKVYGRGDFELPEFPLTSEVGSSQNLEHLLFLFAGIPYFKFLKTQESEAPQEGQKMAFARLQRLHLENYLLALIKAVMFRPEANRLAQFFEISALSISLAKSGGVQGKAGILRVIGNQTSRRSVGGSLNIFSIGEAATARWWTVRESFLVAVDEPSSVSVWRG
jgi:phospholipase D1/2